MSTQPPPKGTEVPATLFLIRFRPLWDYIEVARELGRAFCQGTFANAALAERARLVIQEALENAVKYSAPGPESELELQISTEGEHVEFSVGSRPDPAHLQSLRQELERVCASEPHQAYLEAMTRAAMDPDASARLGLARMRFEGNVELSVVEEPDGRIRLTAKSGV
jgi:hypothetical protein